MNKSRSSISVN